MKKYILIIISTLSTVALSGCSNVPASNINNVVESATNTKQVCKRVPRHKTYINICKPVIKLN